MSETVERGSLFVFYRNKIDVEKARSLDDVQRTYLLLVPDGGSKARLLVIGRKRLPPIIEGEADPREREWMMITATGSRRASIYPWGETRWRATPRVAADCGALMAPAKYPLCLPLAPPTKNSV